MKKISCIFLFIVSMNAVKAQIQLGVKAGINLTTFNADYVSDISYSQRTDFNAGLIVSLPLGSSHFSLQPEVLYSGQGANITTNDVKGVYNFQTLNFPVLIKYISVYHFFLETGLQAGFMLDANLEEAGYPTKNIKSQTKSPEASWVFGLGYQLPMNLGLDIRYNWGLTDVAYAGSDSYNNTSVRNSVFQVGLYYLFGNLFPAEKN